MSRQIRRVPITFDWPTGLTWGGFLNPFRGARTECPSCGGSGYAKEAKQFGDQWHGNSPFDPVAYGAVPLTLDHPAVQAFAERNVRSHPGFYVLQNGEDTHDSAVRREAWRLFRNFRHQWSHHLIQADVDTLVEDGRLYDFTHTFIPGEGWTAIDPAPRVTAEEVNAWSLSGMGHDQINQSICLRSRCQREGVPFYCQECGGDGDHWPSQAHKELCEAYENINPPSGEAYQMWETVSEGSPISPPFAMPEELARWLTETGASAGGSRTATYEQWLNLIHREWAPSMVVDKNGLRSGVEVLGDIPSVSPDV